jgi:hypothetical protein
MASSAFSEFEPPRRAGRPREIPDAALDRGRQLVRTMSYTAAAKAVSLEFGIRISPAYLSQVCRGLHRKPTGAP